MKPSFLKNLMSLAGRTRKNVLLGKSERKPGVNVCVNEELERVFNTARRFSRQSNKGFSLIELMTCIIIIALLSSFAVPIYKNHVNRARLLEGLVLVEPIKATLQDKGLSKGFEKLKDNASAGIASPESFAGEAVDTITVLSGGKIEVVYHQPEGKLLFTPHELSGLLKWSCESETETLNEILPPNCSPLSSS